MFKGFDRRDWTVRLSLVALGALCAAAATAAATADPKPAPVSDKSPAIATPAVAAKRCFRLHDWNGWRTPDGKTMYIRVGISDLWRIDMKGVCSGLRSTTSHLVTRVHSGDLVCDALDLDLSVQDTNGFTEPCIIESIRPLTDAEAKALDSKDRP